MHPPFFFLKKMFPPLFENLNVSAFHCEVCELAKHHQTSFPLNIKKVFLSIYFDFHTDV